MQARITQRNDIVVLHLAGRVDVETAEPFRRACMTQLLGRQVIFDFTSLSFVGSSGILPFLETLQDFADKNKAPFKFSGVGVEFRKVFSATTLNSIEIHETEASAIEAFLNPKPRHQAAAFAAPVADDAVSEQAPASYGLLSLKVDAGSEAPAKPLTGTAAKIALADDDETESSY